MIFFCKNSRNFTVILGQKGQYMTEFHSYLGPKRSEYMTEYFSCLRTKSFGLQFLAKVSYPHESTSIHWFVYPFTLPLNILYHIETMSKSLYLIPISIYLSIYLYLAISIYIYLSDLNIRNESLMSLTPKSHQIPRSEARCLIFFFTAVAPTSLAVSLQGPAAIDLKSRQSTASYGSFFWCALCAWWSLHPSMSTYSEGSAGMDGLQEPYGEANVSLGVPSTASSSPPLLAGQETYTLS